MFRGTKIWTKPRTLGRVTNLRGLYVGVVDIASFYRKDISVLQ